MKSTKSSHLINSFWSHGQVFLGTILSVIVRSLRTLTGDKLRPNDLTFSLMVLHIPVAFLVAGGNTVWAAALLSAVTMMSALDGELARQQHSVSDTGKMLDEVSDRVQESALYIGLTYLFMQTHAPLWVIMATVTLLAASQIIPYIRTKAESLIATYGHELPYRTLARMYWGGIAPYGLRISIIVGGLLAGGQWLQFAVGVAAVFTVISLSERFITIIRRLR